MEYDVRSVEILPAAESDAAAILEIQKCAFHKQGILYADLTLPPLIQTLDELRRDFNIYSFLKAVDKRTIVGSVRGIAKGETCCISRLVVHPDHQNGASGKS